MPLLSRLPLTTRRGRAPLVMAAAFGGSAVLHAVRPATFRTMVPTYLPGRPESWVWATAPLEAALAYGLVRGTRWAGPAAAATLVGFLPAHVQMTQDAGTGRNPGPADRRSVALARFPLQAAMVWAVVRRRPVS